MEQEKLTKKDKIIAFSLLLGILIGIGIIIAIILLVAGIIIFLPLQIYAINYNNGHLPEFPIFFGYLYSIGFIFLGILYRKDIKKLLGKN